MRKKTVNTIIIAENFFEAAAFNLKKGELCQQIFVTAFLNPAQKEASPQIIKSACQKKGVELKRYFLAVIPRFQVTIKNLELPSTIISEIKQMVIFQLQNSLPYKVRDLVIQNLIYPSSKEGYSQVMSVVVQKEIINDFLEIFRLSQVKVSKIALSSTVLLNRFKTIYKKEPFFKDTNLLINIEGESVDFVFIKNGQILLSRGVLLKKDDFDDSFLKEAEKSLSLFNHKFSDKLWLVFLWGRGPDLGILADSIARQTNLKTQVKKDENLLKSLAYCSYSEEEDEINLMPQVLKEKQRRSLKRRNLIKIAISSTVIIVFLILALFFDFKEKEKELTALNNQIEEIESDAVEIQKKKIIIENAADKQTQTLQSLEILAELYSITQPGIFFNSLMLTPAKSAVIKGQAEELNKILDFAGRLESSRFFKNVDVKYTSKRRLKKKEIIDFEIVFFINQP